MNNQTAIIYNLLCKLNEKYLTSERIRRAILEGNISRQTKIELIDAICQTIVTSLNFGDYRRAVEYLILTERLCKNFFSE